MTAIILIAVMLIITAFASSEMDTIKHPNAKRTPLIDKKLFKKLLGKHYQSFRDSWYMANNWKGHTYFKKTVTIFLLDGWHLFKFFRIWSFSVIVAIAVVTIYFPTINIWWNLLIGFGVTFIHGILFEIFYQDILGI